MKREDVCCVRIESDWNKKRECVCKSYKLEHTTDERNENGTTKYVGDTCLVWIERYDGITIESIAKPYGNSRTN